MRTAKAFAMVFTFLLEHRITDTLCGTKVVKRHNYEKILATRDYFGDIDRWGEYWRFTTLSARKLFEQAFPSNRVTILTYGNVLAANAFLQGLAVEDLRRHELDYQDPEYQLLITVRAAKLEGSE